MTDDLVAGDDRQPVGLEVTAHQLEVGAAHGAGLDREEQLAVPGDGVVALLHDERPGAVRRPRPREDHRPHQPALVTGFQTTVSTTFIGRLLLLRSRMFHEWPGGVTGVVMLVQTNVPAAP